ncbi:hypothetical protein [Nitratireductor pacificus]|uniref:Uncharacterized protein n=1 Tax=Nitratireductor pacificus pht-3B TaxID=391937 RepID=K2M9K7_9HYPH|nr:hypothetical protein [Nitratireductor pacificus]EKF17675.1 hypothetical protein NA2_16487 [Nitratireductor pacificus pht-3B]
MTSTKVHINTKALTIEIEGEDDFVRTYLDRLLPIIERIGSDDGQPEGERPAGDADPDDRPSVTGKSRPEKVPAEPRQPRKASRRAGPSCRQRIKALRDEGFFNEPHGIAEIVEKLRQDGHVYSLNQVGAALSTMSGSNEIRRASVDGRYRYFFGDAKVDAADEAKAS